MKKEKYSRVWIYRYGKAIKAYKRESDGQVFISKPNKYSCYEYESKV